MTNPIALQAGTELVGDYRIDRVLGAGGFGITYLAHEIAIKRPVTIKEYFPADFAARADGVEAVPRSQGCAGDYRWGLDRFIEEAQALGRLKHRNIVGVFRYFRANSTAYMVLEFEKGQSLKSWLKGLGRAPRQKELDQIVPPILDALEMVHSHDYLHRDIAPDNIIIRDNDEPVLIDFGSARSEIASHSRTVSALVKPGYSPYEQYAETSRQQGPWTDIYALGATLYHATTGKRPPDAPSRMVKDELVPAREAALASYRSNFLRAIDRALALPVEARPQSIAAWRGDLLAPDERKPWFQASRSKAQLREPEPAIAAPRADFTPQPPPPDAPGPKGGMLDFIEGFRKKTAPDAAANSNVPPRSAAGPDKGAAAAPAATVKLGEGDTPRLSSFFFRRKAASAPAPAPAAAVAQVPAVVVRPPRPQKVKTARRSWRPLLFKLLVGVGISSAAVALFNDRPARLESRGQGIVTSQVPVQSVLIGQLRGHIGSVTSLAYSDDGRTLVTAGRDSTVRVWNVSGLTLIRTLVLDDGPATAVAVAGSRVLTGHANGQIVLRDYERADRITAYKRNDAEISAIAFAGGNTRFAVSSNDGKVTIWDTAETGAPIHMIDAHDSAATALAFARTDRGPLLASGGADRTVKTWSLDTFEMQRRYRGHAEQVSALAFSQDGKMLASASLDGSIRIWSTSSHSTLRRLVSHKGKVSSLAFSPVGDALASAGDDGSARLWDFRKSRNAARTLAGQGGSVMCVAFAPDGSSLASAGEDGIVRLWVNPLAKVAATN